MSRPVSGTLVVAALVGAAALAAAFVLGRPPRAARSVVLVTIDTLRADRLGSYGGAGNLTPRLGALAAEGVLFEDASSASPLTLPSHATMLTGLLPPRHGLRDNDTPRALPPAEGREFRTAAEILGAAGYGTAAFVSGATLAPRWGLEAGFEVYDAPAEGETGALGLGERPGAETVDRALGWLRTRPAGKPFLLWVHLFDPHHPYRAPSGKGHPHDSAAAYDEEVAYADAQVGRLLDGLRELGRYEGTVIAACSDHGEGLGEHGEATHGYFLHRSTLRVPWILRAPDRVPAGTRVKEPVSLADLLPTLLDAARSLPPNLVLDGVSRVPGKEAAGPSRQYAETLHGWRAFRWAQSVAARSGDLRLIDHGGGRRRVHDLAADPGEEKDLGASAPPAAATAAAEARGIFAAPPRWRAPGAAAGAGGDLASLGYVTGRSPIVPEPEDRNGLLPLPDASFLRRFDAALRGLERARTLEAAEEAQEELQAALGILQTLDAANPSNPATAFWIGRAWRQKARSSPPGTVNPWIEAFRHFQEAGRRGYQEPRTVSLMMEAAFHGGQFEEMRKAALLAVKTMDGDSGFWTWVGLAHIRGGQAANGGVLTAEDRTLADEALRKALDRARSDAERERIREVRALIR